MIERRDWETHSALAITAKSGNYDIVDHLLRIGADPNNNGSAIPALYMAAKHNHEQVCGLYPVEPQFTTLTGTRRSYPRDMPTNLDTLTSQGCFLRLTALANFQLGISQSYTSANACNHNVVENKGCMEGIQVYIQEVGTFRPGFGTADVAMDSRDHHAAASPAGAQVPYYSRSIC